MNLKIQNLAWIFVEKFSLIGLSFCVFFVFALILTPDEYGSALYSLAIVEILALFFSAIWTNPLIRADENVREIYSSVFWLGTLFVSLLICSLITLIFIFNDEQFLTLLIGLASIKVPLTIMARPFISEALKTRQFKSLALRTITAKILGATGAITLAYKGFGSFAVIFQAVSIEFVSLIILSFGNLSLISKRPKIPLLLNISKEGLGIGLRELTLKGSNSFLIICLGIFTNKEFVGYFGFAMRLLELPYTALQNGLNSYTITVFKNKANTSRILGETFANLTLVFTYFWGFALVFIYIFSDIIISLLFSNKWLGSSNLVKILCVAFLIQALTVFSGSLLASLGKSSKGLRLEMIFTFMFFVLLPLTLYFLNSSHGMILYLLFILCKSMTLFASTLNESTFDSMAFAKTTTLNILMAFIAVWISKKGWDYFLLEGVIPIILISLISLTFYFALTYMTSKSTLNLVKETLK
ncbi:MAG: O-antigen/teichoic acid export membrane protein [Glaciecola sp.]|jgi:O-antigen/teichoic acid export membrane protein